MITDAWDKAAVVAQIAAAFGTFGAVVMSLWLTFRLERPRVQVCFNVIDERNVGKETGTAVRIAAVNVGTAPTTISSIYWRVGTVQPHQEMQFSVGDPRSSGIPTLLPPGSEARYYTPLHVFATNAVSLIRAIERRRHWWRPLPKVELLIVTASGQVGKQRLDRLHRRWLLSLAPKAPPPTR